MPVGKPGAPRGLVTKTFYKTPVDFIFPVPDPFAGEAEFAPRRDGVGIAAADEGEGALLWGVGFQCFVT